MIRSTAKAILPSVLSAIAGDPQVKQALWGLDAAGWRGVIHRTNALIEATFQAHQVRNPSDAPTVALINQVLDFHAFALKSVALDGLSAPAKIREEGARLTECVWGGVSRTIKLVVDETSVLITKDEEVKARIEIEHLSSAVDAAQADASTERRRADLLEKQVGDLKRQLAAHGSAPKELLASQHQITALNAQIKAQQRQANKERYDLTKALERAQRIQLEQAGPELTALRERVREFERLAQRQSEVVTMPKLILQYHAHSLLEAMSLHAHVRAHSQHVKREGMLVISDRDLLDAVNAWEFATRGDYVGHLRGLESVQAVLKARAV